MKRLLQTLMISLTISIVLLATSCQTPASVGYDIKPFAEIVPVPSRPILENIPTELPQAMKIMGVNLINLTTHIVKLEAYIKWEESYYTQIITKVI